MIPLRAIVLSLGVAMGAFFPFVSVLLRARGFSPAEIGLITSVGAIGFTVAVPAWGHLADVRLGRPRTLRLCAVGSAIAVLALLVQWPVWAICILFVSFTVFQSAWQPLSDAITVSLVRGRDYGRIRLLTSLSFAVAATLAGLVYDRTGYAPAHVALAAGALVMAGAAWFIPDGARADLHGRAEPAGVRVGRTWRLGSIGVALREAPTLGWVLVAVGLLHIGIISGFTYLGLRITELGGSPSQVALASGLSAGIEIPAMLLAPRLARRIGLRGLFAASALLYAAAMASWALSDAPIITVATRALTGLAFAGVIVSVVLTIAHLLPRDLQATGQSLYQTTGFGIAAIIANGLGGVLYGSVGHAAVFGLGGLLAVVAALVGFRVLPGRVDDYAVGAAPG